MLEPGTPQAKLVLHNSGAVRSCCLFDLGQSRRSTFQILKCMIGLVSNKYDSNHTA